MTNPDIKDDVSYDIDEEQKATFKERRFKRLQRKRIQFVIRRIILVIIAVVVVAIPLIVVASFCGLFNARIYVKYTGTGKPNVTNDQLSTALVDLNGRNVFRISQSLAQEKMSQIPYVNDKEVTISKSFIPPRVTIFYTETSPYGYYKIGDEFLAFGSDGRILEHFKKSPKNIPLVTNMNDTYIKDTDSLKTSDDRVKALILCLKNVKHYGYLDKLTEITVDGDDFITFVYDDRYTISCGSSYEIDSKVGLFDAAIKDDSMTNSPKGTFDLSTPGKAIYSP